MGRVNGASHFTASPQAKAITVPTDDLEVKARLREQGEPICEGSRCVALAN